VKKSGVPVAQGRIKETIPIIFPSLTNPAPLSPYKIYKKL
jgi:hypothetical protein